MSELFVPQNGAVFSADIAVPEHERELRFYSRVLGTGSQPLWQEDLLNNLGVPIVGVGPRRFEFEHLPLQWMPHIQVADVAASVQRALEKGAAELMHGKDNDGRSLWAVLQDPFGAAFGLVPVASPEQMPPSARLSADQSASVGRIAWLDLTVPDAAAARDFYRQVVGWSVQDMAVQDGQEAYADYAMLGEDGTPCAGICYARGPNADLPPVWLIYLSIGDLDESVRRVKEEGGRVLKVSEVEGGRFAVVQDPVGAYFALWQG